MKFIIKIIIIALLALVAQTFLPWWSVALTSFVGGAVIYTRGIRPFIAGFIAIFLLWGIKAYLIDMANEQILSTRISQLFSVTPNLLILITAAVGGLVGGFASLSGSSLIGLFKSDKKRRNKYYS